MLTVNLYHLATYPTVKLDKQVIALKIQMSNYRKPCKKKVSERVTFKGDHMIETELSQPMIYNC